jgi:phosphoribosyl 1,2-cyclic phosphodiesterase
LRVCLLASGSKGNSIFIETQESRILIDAGLSGKEIQKRLAAISVEPADIDALFITHEHSDHVRGVIPFSNRFKTPVFVHYKTRGAFPDADRLKVHQEFDSGDPVQLKDLKITPFPLTHDAVAPVGFTIETIQGKIGVATDLGVATRLVADQLKNCRILVLESNHDEEMLRDGPYPWELKQRIRSRHGHLSNNASAELLTTLLWENLEAVFLAHLSEQNNKPGLAEKTARKVLETSSRCSPQIIVGCQALPSACFYIPR